MKPNFKTNEDPKAPWEHSKRGIFGGIHFFTRRLFESFGMKAYAAYALASFLIIPLLPLTIQLALLVKAKRLLVRSVPLALAKGMVKRVREDRVYYFSGIATYLKERSAKKAKDIANAAIEKAVAGKAKFSAKTVESLMKQEQISPAEVAIGTIKNAFGLLLGRPYGGTLSTERYIILRNVGYALVATALSPLFIALFIHSLTQYGSLASYFTVTKLLTFDLNNDALSYLFYSIVLVMFSGLMLRLTENRLNNIQAPRKAAWKTGLLTNEEYESPAIHVIFVASTIDRNDDLFYFKMPNLVYGYGSDPTTRISKLGSHVNMLHKGAANFRVSKPRTIHGSSSSELTFMNTAQTRPPIFSVGGFEISQNFEIWQYFVGNKLKELFKKTGREHVFLGEIMDPAYEGDTHVFIDLDDMAHFGFVGTTGSGKTSAAIALAYGIKYAYPDTILLFSDGKAGMDWAPIADASSIYPIADTLTKDASTDNMMEMVNLISYIQSEYDERRKLFKQSGAKDITAYRALGNEMPRIVFFIEEFGGLVKFFNWEATVKTPGTPAHALQRFAAEGRYCGIHLMLMSQRYQNTDYPTDLRSLLTMLVHRLEKSDADKVLKIPEAQGLPRGVALTSIPGLKTSSGDSNIKLKSSYLGGDDRPAKLIKDTIKFIAPSLKRKFNYKIIYKTADGPQKLSRNTFVTRVSSFLDEQNWKNTQLVVDSGSDKVQLEAIKAYREKVLNSDGTTATQLTQYPDASTIGISVLEKTIVLNPDTFFDIQEAHGKYGVIIVFLVDPISRSERTEIHKLLTDANERGSRFIVIEREAFDEFSKKVSGQEGRLDLIKGRVQMLLGLKEAVGEEIPLTMKIEQIITKTGLKRIPSERLVKSTPVFKFTGPAGRTFCFVIGGNSKDLDGAAKEVALDLSDDSDGHVVFFVAMSKIDDKKLTKAGIITISKERIHEMFNETNGNAIIATLLRVAKIVKDSDDKYSFIPLLSGARVEVITKFAELQDGLITEESKIRYLMKCYDTGVPLFFKDGEIAFHQDHKHFITLPINTFTAEKFGIPDGCSLFLREGVAPLGTMAGKVRDTRKEKPAFESGFSEKDGVLIEA